MGAAEHSRVIFQVKWSKSGYGGYGLHRTVVAEANEGLGPSTPVERPNWIAYFFKPSFTPFAALLTLLAPSLMRSAMSSVWPFALSILQPVSKVMRWQSLSVWMNEAV